jgi:predicted nucleic acid-binding protein
MPVVSNTSPILNLAIIGKLDLLRQQFGEVLIPPMVLQELKVDAELPGVEPIRLALQNHWLRVFELSNTDIARALRRDLDNGEAEAIALASVKE